MTIISSARIEDIIGHVGMVPTLSEARQLAVKSRELQRQVTRLTALLEEEKKVKAAGQTLWQVMRSDGLRSKTKLAEHLKINRATVTKYLDDELGTYHRIIGGVFMSATYTSVGAADGEQQP